MTRLYQPWHPTSMTTQEAQQLERIIGQMTEAEKRELIERLERSLNGDQDHSTPKDQTESKAAHWRAWTGSHPRFDTVADDSREAIYEGRGE